MKLWKVTYERDGLTIKAPGISETDIKRDEIYFACESADTVWAATAYLRNDPERRFFSLAEVLPMVEVLQDTSSGQSK